MTILKYGTYDMTREQRFDRVKFKPLNMVNITNKKIFNKKNEIRIEEVKISYVPKNPPELENNE